MNLYYKMLRMKARRRARKMRGGLGGLLGETWQGYVSKAGEDANKGAARFQRGMSKAEQIRKENVDQFTAARKAGLKAGAPPKQAAHSNLAKIAMQNLSIANQGHLAPQVAAQYRDAGEGSQRTTSENPLTSSPVHSGHAPRTGRQAPRQIVYTGGKRKTKKRRRRRKKKKTKRKKRRRKRKTKRRKSRKKSRKK
jgi:hypothetical protein